MLPEDYSCLLPVKFSLSGQIRFSNSVYSNVYKFCYLNN